MKKFLTEHWLVILLILLLTIFYFWGAKYLPFHPDEATQLYMSRDFNLLFSHPLSMAFDPLKENDLRQQYRLLDSPITKYLLGLGRFVRNQPPLLADWDWGKTWEENRRSGALPDENILLTGRYTITALLPFSLFFLYLTVEKINGKPAAIVAAILLGTHSLTIFHARRAMAEGALTLGVVIALWSLFYGREQPWLTGLCLAFAINTKQSTIALVPVVLLAVSWVNSNKNRRLKTICLNVIFFLIPLIFITYLLNPLFWKDPISAFRSSITARQELLHQQVKDISTIAPEKVLDTTSERIAVMVANLYVGPPTHSSVSNLQPTVDDLNNYLTIPGHNLLRGLVGGGCLLALTILGIVLAIISIWRGGIQTNRNIILLLLATIVQGTALLIAVPLPWPRYAIPMVPFVCIWIAFGFSQFANRFRATTQLP
jgi:4-amino-4-deoxy-L-arabinose transferase-like glycosyltransferase